MSTQSIAAPFPIFCDRDGSPLDAGYIYVGAVNLPPQTNPIAVYWDADLTIPAAQPIRTSGGYAMRNGSPSRFYAAGQYSLLVTDWKGQLVYSSAQSDGVSVGASVQSFSGTGAQTNFTLAADPGVAESLIVRISGAVQTPGVDFTVIGTTLSFTEAPPAGTDNIVVQAIGEVGVSGAGSLVNASAVVYSDTTPLPTILTPQGLGGAIQVNTSTGAVSIGSNLGVVGAVTLSGGTANGVLYLNGSKVASSGSALTFDGTVFSALSGGTTVIVSRGAASNQAFISAAGNGGVVGASSFDMIQDASSIAYLYQRANQPLVFGVNNAEQMRLTTTGLGIGTASPGTRLDVSGVIRIRGGNSLTLQNAAADANATISANGGSGSNAMSFNGGAMTLDASGNLGLGVTPSAWESTCRMLQLGAVGTVGRANSGQTQLGFNYFINSSGQYIYIQSLNATRYEQISGEHRFFSAASGTAGNVITFTQAMTLDASGNLGLGTASPGSKLEVYGGGAGTTSNVTIGNAVTALQVGVDASNNCQIRTAQNVPILIYTNATTRGQVSADGNFVWGTAALATTATAGFPWIPSCAGVPTGAPTAPYTNAAAMVVDTTNNRLYVRVGSTWRYATLT